MGKEAQVLKEKNLMKSISHSSHVPEVLSTSVDQSHANILLDTYLACPLISVFFTPLSEPSAQFCAAMVVIA